MLFNEATDSLEAKKYIEAIPLYKKAIAIDTNFLDAYDNLGLTYRQLQMLDSAEYFYKTSFEKDPKNSTPVQNLAVVAELQNIPRKAMLLYYLLSKMAPKDPEGYFGLARMNYVLGRDDEALQSGQKAEELYKKENSPLIKDCYLVLTVICIRAGKGKLARKYLSMAKESGAKVEKELEDAVFKK